MLAVLSGWREELSVNNGGGGSWTEASMKISGQFGDAEGNRWSGGNAAAHYRAAKHQSWTQERQGNAACTGATQRVQIVYTVQRVNADYRTASDLNFGRHHQVTDNVCLMGATCNLLF